MQTAPDGPVADRKVITLLTCKVPEGSAGKVNWMKDGKIVTSDRNRVNVLPNNTLILTDTDVIEPVNVRRILDFQ